MKEPKITYLGKPIRDTKGRFARMPWIHITLVTCAVLIGIALYGDHWVGQELKAGTALIVPIARADVIVPIGQKIELAKEKIVNDIASCESGGVKEPDATLILDSNNQMSIGAWQWQIKSVQHYVNLFEGRTISRVEAIQIAIDHDKAKALVTKVLFEEKDGYENWHTCGVKLGVASKIELINSLTN